MSWVWHRKKESYREPDWNAPVPESNNSRLEYLYDWERRCRGYSLHPYPVNIEPPFSPYQPDAPKELLPAHTLPSQAAPHSLSHIALQLLADQKVSLDSAEAFLSGLPFSHQPIAFEILADNTEIVYQITCSPDNAQGITSSAQIHWPKADISESSDFLVERFPAERKQHATKNSFVVEFGLQHFAFLPIACSDSLTADPLAGVVAALGALEPNEIAGLQILFTPANRQWNDALLEVAEEFETPPAEGSFHRRENPIVTAARVKTELPLYAVVIRVFAISDEGQAKAFALCKKIGSALSAFNQSQGQTGNALLALANQDAANVLPANGVINTVFDRSSYRSGLLLSLPELAGLVHPPGHTLQHPKLLRLDPNARSLSEELLQAEGATIGIHPYRNQEQRVVWPDQFRNRHAYILGATRMGKSTLLLNLITQDIAADRGLCLIDPHGDLALDVLERIPEHRKNDVLYLDLSDREYPLSLGLLEASNEQEQRLLCSDLLSVLRRLFATSWGDRLEHILRHAILTLLSASQRNDARYTLRDIRPLLSNKAFRKRVTAELDDPELKAFWNGEFHSYSASNFAPLYNKLGLLISSPLVRNIIAGRQSKLSFTDVIHGKRILLVNLASSQIGNDQSHFLGALLVSKLQIAAMQSLRLGKSERTPFTLYVDEFQNFVVSSFETILSEAGKAGLSLVTANQFLEQLSAQLQIAILSNAGTLVSFRVSSDSGRLLEKEFAGRYKSNDLVSLQRGEAIVRIGSAVDSYDVNTLPPPATEQTDYTDKIRRQSHEAICRPRQEVEEELAADAKRQAEEQEAEERAEVERKETEKALKKKIADEKKANAKRPKPESSAAATAPTIKENSQQIQEETKESERSAEVSGDGIADVKSAAPISDELTSAPLLEPDCFGVADE